MDLDDILEETQKCDWDSFNLTFLYIWGEEFYNSLLS